MTDGRGLDLRFSIRRGSRAARVGRPRVLFIADLAAGRASAAPVRVDPDRLYPFMQSLAPEIELRPGLPRVFRSLDEFRPEALRPLADEFASDEGTLATPGATDEGRPSATQEPVAETDSDTLSRLLGASERGLPSARGGRDMGADRARAAIDKLASRLVRDIITAPPTRGSAGGNLAPVDARDSALRALLHFPPLQRLEAAWRGLAGLVDAAGGEAVEIDAWPLPEGGLRHLLPAPDERAEENPFYRALAPAAEDASPWSLIVIDSSYGSDATSFAELRGLARVAMALGTPVLADARLELAGSTTAAGLVSARGLDSAGPEASAWHAVRREPGARRIALVLPRVLSRTVYGPKTDPVDGFEFDEAAGVPLVHEQYLWGSAAAAIATGVVAAWREAIEKGGQADAPGAFTLDGLPLVVRLVGGDQALLPCAEVLLPESALRVLRQAGLSPLASFAERTSVRVDTLQSIADPPSDLEW